jgi:hypothetical protein
MRSRGVRVHLTAAPLLARDGRENGKEICSAAGSMYTHQTAIQGTLIFLPITPAVFLGRQVTRHSAKQSVL